MEEHLKHLMQRLGHAINESLSESEAIAEAIGEIRREGHDVYLVLEATIGLSKQKEDRESDDDDGAFSEQDQAFLKALKIAVDE